MSKIVIKNKRKAKIFINRLEFPETVNEKVFNSIQSGNVPEILPLKIVKKRKEIQLICEVTNLIPLSDYFSANVTKTMVINIVSKIKNILELCKKNMWNENNLYLFKDTIFIDPYTGLIRCIMWPVVNNKNENPPFLFLKVLLENEKLDPCENHEYVQTYNDYFQAGLFSLNSFEKMIMKMQGKEMTGSLIQYEEDTKKKKEKLLDKDIEYDPFEGLKNNASAHGFIQCPKCGHHNKKGTNFCSKCGNSLKQTQKYKICPSCGHKNDIHDMFCSECGKGLNESKQAGKKVLLLQKSNKKVYHINKPQYSIGKMNCDCNIDNGFIGRHHADIVLKNGKIYIVDKNSLNKTYVNENIISPETMVEIYPNSKIRLANEEFKIVIK